MSEKAEKKFTVQLTENEVKEIKNSLIGWHDTLVKNYKLNVKPITQTKRKYKKAVDELKTLFKFFNGLK